MKKKIILFLIGAAFIWVFNSCKHIGYKKTLTFTLLQTSDLHNHASGYGPSPDYTPGNNLDNDDVLGGYSRIAGLITSIRNEKKAKNNPVVLVDSGDFFMGTIYDLAGYAPGHAPVSLKYMQMMGYDAITLGNHEFDWSPSGLQFLLERGINNGFSIPIIATNMVTDPVSTADDGIETLGNEGFIQEQKILNLENGLKIGILGIMGIHAEARSPAAFPIKFNHDYKFLQEKVNTLRNTAGVDIVVLLSHGGITPAGTGDDEKIAINVHGIDIIASGHYHTATPTPFIHGDSKTLIFSPGKYGEWLSRLDVTYNISTRKITKTGFKLIPVNDTVRIDRNFEAGIKSYRDAINKILAPLEFSLDMPVSRITWRMSIPGGTESGLGNLVTDAVRAAASNLAPLNDGNSYHAAVVPNGIIRDGFFPGKTGIVSFTDIYNTVPLGKSPDSTQLLPGYPLISIYVTGADLRNICEAGLSIGPDFYLNFSGLRVEYNPALASKFQGVQAVYVSPPDDWITAQKGQPVDIKDTKTLYHIVGNLYSLQMIAKVTGLGLSIVPRDVKGIPIEPGKYMLYRIDSAHDPGVQELKDWQALYFYLSNFFPVTGEGISPTIYGNNGTALNRINIVN
ncbi:MAG: 5'-nucleotidase C-terminal domain-containing protein [Acidobacteria bacterium]|jgi:5'-nucleotidase|nr:5'-nucleotidase C-terminal domain-containing protein [Acidobacteriota bacterium]